MPHRRRSPCRPTSDRRHAEHLALEIRKLTREHDRTGFRSGDADLDRFFARYAGQHQFRHHIGTTYVAIDTTGAIAGFATVSASELSPAAMPATKRKHLPKYPLPVLRLARLAVDERYKGQGVGSLLPMFLEVDQLA